MLPDGFEWNERYQYAAGELALVCGGMQVAMIIRHKKSGPRGPLQMVPGSARAKASKCFRTLWCLSWVLSSVFLSHTQPSGYGLIIT